MPDVVVKHNDDGTVTVCIDDECVTVPASRPNRRPPIRIQLATRNHALGDIDKLRWRELPETGGVEEANHGEGLLRRVQRYSGDG